MSSDLCHKKMLLESLNIPLNLKKKKRKNEKKKIQMSTKRPTIDSVILEIASWILKELSVIVNFL